MGAHLVAGAITQNAFISIKFVRYYYLNVFHFREHYSARDFDHFLKKYLSPLHKWSGTTYAVILKMRDTWLKWFEELNSALSNFYGETFWSHGLSLVASSNYGKWTGLIEPSKTFPFKVSYHSKIDPRKQISSHQYIHYINKYINNIYTYQNTDNLIEALRGNQCGSVKHI